MDGPKALSLHRSAGARSATPTTPRARSSRPAMRRPSDAGDRGRPARASSARSSRCRRGSPRSRSRASGPTIWRGAARRSSSPRARSDRALELVERPDRDHADVPHALRPGHLRARGGPRSRRALGCGAHVAALRRLQVGPFPAEARDLARVRSAGCVDDDTLPQALVPVDDRAGRHPGAGRDRAAGGSAARRPDDPRRTRPGGRAVAEPATVRAMAAGELVALARLQGAELSPVRVFSSLLDADRK